jgi:hypothetical protein
MNAPFMSGQNKSLLLGIIDEVIRQKFQIMLNEDFSNRIFNDIMKLVYSSFGKKPNELTSEDHLKNLNKICLDKAIKYIEKNVVYFPKTMNTQVNNKAIIIKDEDPPRSSTPLSMVPFDNLQLQQQQQNLFKTTDDLYKQMQNDRSGMSQMPQQINFQLPTQVTGQPTSEQMLQMAIEQRKKDFPSINTPSYKPPGLEGQTVVAPQGNGINMTDSGKLTSILLQTPLAIQNPNLVPNLINEIMQNQHLMDLMNKDINMFQQQVTNPAFLQMLVTQIRNKNDPKMRPMSLNDSDPPPSGTGGSGNSVIPNVPVNLDYSKIVAGTEVNQMNQFIPPSDQLVNNVLPDLDQIHLIDFDLSLDFRTDLDMEYKGKNQYPLKFTKFGNISRVELTSCLIPENDLLMDEPYIFVKIEELGGRCYTANHDVTFGKLILAENKNGYLHYLPDTGSCVQYFSQPTCFQHFTVSFLNYNGKYINLREISISKPLKLKKENKLKFITTYTHKLTPGENIILHIYHKDAIDEYNNVQVDSVVDDKTFTVENVFETLSEHMVILRSTVNCSFKFKLSEINWNLLTKKNIQNAQLIKLSQLVNERRQEVLNNVGQDQDVVKYIKNQIQPQAQPQAQVAPTSNH